MDHVDQGYISDTTNDSVLQNVLKTPVQKIANERMVNQDNVDSDSPKRCPEKQVKR
jgi:hypothetical protein